MSAPREGQGESSQALLRREVDQLGRMFGEVIKHHAGGAIFQLVEEIRGMSRNLQKGDATAASQLQSRLAELDNDQLKKVVRCFTIFLELANLAEDRQRVRVLRDRERKVHPAPRGESVRSALADFHRRGLATSEVQEIINRVNIEMVFTAHPTEAKRRSVRRILRRVSDILAAGDAHDLLPRELEAIEIDLRGELHKLWQTDFIRPWRPTVLQEVERGLAIMPVLWSEAPLLLRDLREASSEYYPKAHIPEKPLLRFGSWIGGDRDGNPFVTPDVTAQTLTLLRNHALTAHRTKARKLARSLSISDRLTERPVRLEEAITKASERWPALGKVVEELPPLETYRRWMRVIYWRLRQTLDTPIDAPPDNKSPAYGTPAELAADVQLVADCLRDAGDELVVENELSPWLDQIAVFGLQCARLDLRQHSELYHEAIRHLWAMAGTVDAEAKLDSDATQKLLIDSLASDKLPSLEAALEGDTLSDSSKETIKLFALIRRTARRSGMAPFGVHILSMSRTPSDILAMLWLWRWSERVDGGHPDDAELRLPLAPLFETIDDLNNAPATLRAVFSVPEYRDYLSPQNDEQMVMVGYSDSCKDGGYLAAQWSLQQSQTEMQKVADEFGVNLTFFHGRGGSLGRGGGPAARSILSLPTEAFSGVLRLTEQGEVLAERYSTPEIAYRHLEQVCWASLTAVSRSPEPQPAAWTQQMQELGERSLSAYRKFVDSPNFADFYRAVTPIDEIERLPMGSRPSKRKAGNRIEDLRAIPWVFSWTQCRALLPAWYGLGSAVAPLLDDDQAMDMLRLMYREWPFFQATISNAELAMSKANMPVFELYGKLGTSIDNADQLTKAVLNEYEASTQAICSIVESDKLLDSVPWLQRSIQVRNGYVDPLNVAQVVLLKRIAEGAESNTDDSVDDDLAHLMNIGINGVSAGMRTTG